MTKTTTDIKLHAHLPLEGRRPDLLKHKILSGRDYLIWINKIKIN